MAVLPRIYFTSFLVILTAIRCSSRYHGVQQPAKPCQCSVGAMEIIEVGDACSCAKRLSFAVEVPRSLEPPASPTAHGFRVEVPLVDKSEEVPRMYDVEVEVPVDPSGPSQGNAYGYKLEVPITDETEKVHSYGFDVLLPRRDAVEPTKEYSLHVDRMVVPRRDCCVHD